MRDDDQRIIKSTFAFAALISVLIGLGLYISAEALGIDDQAARWIALAFLAAGLADYLLLRYWDKIFKKRD